MDGRAQRKPRHRADFHCRPRQFARRQRYPIWIDAHRGKAILPRFAAQLDDIRARRFRPQHGVIDQRCDRTFPARGRRSRRGRRWCAFLSILLLDAGDLLHPRRMSAARERSLQPGAQHLFGLARGEQPRPQRQNIGIVVFAAVARGSAIVTKGRANARDFVRGNRRTDARAIDDDPPRRFPARYQFRHLFCDIRIVGGLFVEYANVPNLEAQARQQGLQGLLQAETTVVRTQCDNFSGRDRRSRLPVAQFDDANGSRFGQFAGGRREDRPRRHAQFARARHIL